MLNNTILKWYYFIMAFIPLNVRSGYSFLSSGITIENIVKNVSKLGFEGCAICDFNMHAYPIFDNLMNLQNKKPIFGEEIEIDGLTFKFFILSEEGYLNLIKLSPYISNGIFNNDYDNIKKSLLKNNKGLACVLDTNNIELINKITNQDENFRKTLLDYSKMSEYFYLGINILSNEDMKTAKIVRDFADKYSYDKIAFPFIMYSKKEDAISYEICTAIKNNEKLQIKEKNGPCYFLNENVINKLYSQDEILNTKKILDLSNFIFKTKRGELLKFDKNNNYVLLKSLCFKGLKDKNLENETYKNRLDYELSIIHDMGYDSYFLIVMDYVKYSRNEGILVGPGRGSAAGSLVSYLIGITEIDPIKYGLLFERFLNPARKSMPDIDMDFMDTRREEVIEYLRNKYGKEKVANIVTFSPMHAKQAIRDIGKVYNYPETDISLISKRLSRAKDQLTLRQSYIKNEAFRQLVDSDKYYLEIVSLASKIEDLPRQKSIHAAGVVLNNKTISEVLPISIDSLGNTTTQFEGQYMEDQGFLKMDILGIRNLTTIDVCCKLINKRHPEINIDPYKIPVDDEGIFKLISSGNTMGLFQLESKGMRRSIKILKPNCFNDVAALLALYRPGPMDNIPLYARRKEGKEKVIYPVKELEHILKETYGIIVYQEQINLIATAMAGFSLSEADIFRKAVSKKKLEVLKEVEKKFIDGCIKNGHDYKISKKVYDDILRFADYGFNKSHSVGYAYIACRMGYLKAYYPLEFYSSILLTADPTNNDVKFSDYLKEMKEYGIKILPPSVNESDENYDISNGSLIFPLNSINDIKQETSSKIIFEKSENGLFKDYYDFIVRMYKYKISEKTVEKLIDAGALDCFNHSRLAMKKGILAAFKYAKVYYDEEGKLSLIDDLPKPRLPNLSDEPMEKLANELEALNMMLSDNPLNYKKEILDKNNVISIANLEEKVTCTTCGILRAIKRISTKKKETMAFITIYDQENEIDVTLFPKVYNSAIDLLKTNNILLIKGKLDLSRDDPSFIADEIKMLED